MAFGVKIKEKQKNDNNPISKINYLDLNEYLYENIINRQLKPLK